MRNLQVQRATLGVNNYRLDAQAVGFYNLLKAYELPRKRRTESRLGVNTGIGWCPNPVRGRPSVDAPMRATQGRPPRTPYDSVRLGDYQRIGLTG